MLALFIISIVVTSFALMWTILISVVQIFSGQAEGFGRFVVTVPLNGIILWCLIFGMLAL